MIIFGTRSKVIGQTTIESECSFCGNDLKDFYAVQDYFHIYWVPVFPYRKTYASQCSHCKQALRENDIAPTDKQRVSRMNFAKTPIYMFAGSLILSAVMIAKPLSTWFFS